MKSNIRKKILKFLVVWLLPASVVSVMLALAAFQHQAAEEVTLLFAGFLVLLQSDHFTLPHNCIPQISFLLRGIPGYILSLTEGASGIASWEAARS